MNGIVHAAGTAMKVTFKDLFLVFRIDAESQISLADRTTEDVHERTSHLNSSLKSMIWVISGPVDIRVTGLPISSSACLTKSFAFFVSFL
jgi:hypothetical protein